MRVFINVVRVVVAPELHKLRCGAHVIDLVKLKSRRLSNAPTAKRECGDGNHNDHPKVDAVERRSRRRLLGGRARLDRRWSWRGGACLFRLRTEELPAACTQCVERECCHNQNCGWRVERIGKRAKLW